MEESESSNLDLEFKRYLQILRPYIAQLIDNNVIAICNAWIHRLSNSSEKEKPFRNKYVFTLCYQLARGTLEEPFTNYPPEGMLPRVSESIISEESSTEVECYVVNAEDPNTEVLFDSKREPLTDTEYLSHSTDYERSKTGSQDYDSDVKSNRTHKRGRKQTIMCYTCPEILKKYIDLGSDDVYESRANNLIKKLRDIKAQNILLHKELMTLKEESSIRHSHSSDDCATKVDRAISAMLQSNESSSSLKSLKFRLQEVQDSRNSLIEKIANLQEIINNFDEMKKHEIEYIEVKHKLDIMNIKETVKNELNATYEKKIEDLKEEYEVKMDSLKNKSNNDIEILATSKNVMIEERNKTIMAKDKEIVKLNEQIDDLKMHLHSVLEKFIDKPTSNHSGEDTWKFKAEQLEKKLNKSENSRAKCARMFESKVAQLQREKHLSECSLQLQMVRQRTQVVNEVTDENQTELTAALDKLESKYKEIVANVQAAAIQRRMQDQTSLESILQAACGISNENNISTGTNGQYTKSMRNQNLTYDGGVSPLHRGNKVGNICVGNNKSFVEDTVVTSYCLNGERMGELFDRVYIPQRDNPENLK